MSQERAVDDKKKTHKVERKQAEKRHAGGPAELAGLAGLQQRVGNQAVQRILVQGSGQGTMDLDEETAGRINRERGGGQALDESTQARMGTNLGHDFGNVRVHTSSEADALSHQLGAKAFTTGQDVFFREGAYNPHSSGGQELLGHELTHGVQQGTGVVKGHGQMAVNPPGDTFERQADAAAKAAVGGAGRDVQRQAGEEEEVQMQAAEEEEVQAQADEEEVQMQEDEDEEEVQAQADEEEVQMQAAPGEEEEMA